MKKKTNMKNRTVYVKAQQYGCRPTSVAECITLIESGMDIIYLSRKFVVMSMDRYRELVSSRKKIKVKDLEIVD